MLQLKAPPGIRPRLVALLATSPTLLAGCEGGPAQPEPTPSRYEVTVLGTLGGEITNASDINDGGVVVGSSHTRSGETHAFMWTDGQMTDLGAAGSSSYASGINNRDEIVGFSAGRAVLWRNGAMIDLGMLDGHDWSWAKDINDHGQILGWSDFYVMDTSNDPQHAVLWEDGVLTDLGPVRLDAINSEGTAVGCRHDWYLGDRVVMCTRATVWRDGVLVDDAAPAPPGSITGWIHASDINDDGVVIGHGTSSEGTHPYLWQGSSATALQFPGKRDLVPLSLSRTGRMFVGFASSQRGQDTAVLWEDGEWTDLGLVAQEALGTDAAVTSRATAINSRGEIVGNVTNAQGRTRAVLWQPLRRRKGAAP